MKNFLIVLLLCTAGRLFASGPDYQFWGAGGIKFKAGKSLQIIFDGESRYYEHATHKKFNKTAIEIKYNAQPWLQLGAQYWKGGIKGSDWVQEQKPVIYANLCYRAGTWEVSNQHKYEYRVRQGVENWHMYKVRLQLAKKQHVHFGTFQHYLNNELFYNSTLNYANINRVRLGTRFNLSRHLQPDIGLAYQSNNRHTHWDHVLAFTFKLWMMW